MTVTAGKIVEQSPNCPDPTQNIIAHSRLFLPVGHRATHPYEEGSHEDGKGQRKASSDILGGVEGVVIKLVHWAKIGKKTGTFGFFLSHFHTKMGDFYILWGNYRPKMQ